MHYGYFDDQAKEYVILRPDLPVSWTNYLGVRELCTVLSHQAGGYTFYRSPEHGRITRFRPNAVPLDRPGYYVYLRDEETGEFWTITGQPAGKAPGSAEYEARHGLSYSRFICRYRDIFAEQRMFIPLEEEVLLWDVRLENHRSVPCSLGVFSYIEWSFGHVELDNQNFQMSLYSTRADCKEGIIELHFFYEPQTRRFFTADFEPDGFDCLRDRFLGPRRGEEEPIAVERGRCFGSSEAGGNQCGALHKRLFLAPGEKARLLFLMGPGSREQGAGARKIYSDPSRVDAAFDSLKRYWGEKIAACRVDTPHEGMNIMLNSWNLYQAETCVVWSRFASFIEVGGRTGLGFRDTAQDLMAVVHSHPQKTRQRIFELLKGLTRRGYGLHLFDPAALEPSDGEPPSARLLTVVPGAGARPAVHGIEDACSDDALWLVPSLCEWVKETGEVEFFDLTVPYADGGAGTVYEHLQAILEFSAQEVGPSGLCKGLRADWNDCLNLGGGESGMVTFMHRWALIAFAEAARHLGRLKDAQHAEALAERVGETCRRRLWDGEWYLRGVTREGKAIGTREDEEGRLFLNAQSWAVLSGVARGEEGRRCMDAVDRHLYSPFGLHLLWPAYTKPDDHIGTVTRVCPGLKENGSIFCHPNAWAIIAECLLGRGGRAMKFYDALLPYLHNDAIEIREAEPYVYCQFIAGRDHPAHGRARHPWLTGTAGWVYTAAVRFMLGIRPGFTGLTVDPCIPADWPGFEAVRRWRGAEYRITVKNPRHVERGIQELWVDGKKVDGPIPPRPPGSACRIEAIMG